MKATFIGKDRSLGFNTNQVYDITVTEQGKFVLLLAPRFCPYESWKAFYDNWQRVVDIPA